MAQFRPLFLDTGSIEVVPGNRIVDLIHFHVTASISSSYTTLLPDPYLFATMSADRTNALSATSTSLFEFEVPTRQENYFYPHNSIVGVSTSATATGVRIGLQSNNSADAFAHIKVASTLTAHTIANIGTQSPTTFALPGSMVAITTIYPAFVKGLYNNSIGNAALRNVVLLQPETNNTVTARVGSVSYNKFVGYSSNPLDRSFIIGTGFSNVGEYVTALDTQTDGKIVVGGIFTSYNGTTQNYITRLNPNGTRDTSFTIGTGFNLEVYAIAIQTDGKILIGGFFTSYNGTTQNRITRLNSDGTRDTSFTIGTGFDAVVLDIKIQTDGKILVGGAFTSYNGTTQNYVTRLNSNGTRDTSFDAAGGTISGWVRKLAIQTDGKIIAAGEFVGPTNRLIRLNTDGSQDFDYLPGNPNSDLRSLAIQNDDKIIIGGFFTSYSGSTQNSITRLNTDASIDTSFNIGTGIFSSATGFGVSVDHISIQQDGKILAVGAFDTYSGSLCNYIVRINTDGTADEAFNQNNKFFVDPLNPLSPQVTYVQTDRKIIVGGLFEKYDGISQNKITRIFSDFDKNQTSVPLHLSTGSLRHITGGHTITSSFLPATSSQWFSQSLAANVANTSNTVYATVFSLTGLEDNKRYLANLYIIGQSAAAATGFRMRVQNGSNYRGTLYTPTSTTAPAIQNSADGTNITSIAAGTWPTVNTKYLVFGEYTFIKTAGTTPEVQILSETNGTAVTAFSGSVIFYTPIH
jgi:uncharacterized delta-60 repeat protein